MAQTQDSFTFIKKLPKHFSVFWKIDKHTNFNLCANQETISQLGVLLNANDWKNGG